MKSYFLAGLLLLPPFSAPIRADSRALAVTSVGVALAVSGVCGINDKELKNEQSLKQLAILATGLLVILSAESMVRLFDNR